MSTVRVGLRIRPLLSKEQFQSLSIHDYDSSSVTIKGQHKFTYDHVFGPDMSQEELYVATAAPMMKNILEGYNVTIMAYGQTGSGKTFTMGTADNHSSDVANQGLIPRFVSDLFENIQANANNDANGVDNQQDRRDSKVKVSFLEIYGEDVYDLIGMHTKSLDRPSLAVREDEAGHVFVQGLQEVEVPSATAALEQLYIGSRNRITGSTAMNAGSSRSHAVFSVTVQQSIRSATSDDDDAHMITSTLTFVDLAGSERIKRTGAEGQRMKEGIQINSGLFNLGQVINCLADEQRIKQGVKVAHVPYRNSKLTHLLKDALGGNSQTLFLACVSPAESNESETLSTLNYAKQARNIQNKPVQNIDKTQLEIRRLKLALRSWMTTAVGLKFGIDGSQLPPPPSNGDFSPLRPPGPAAMPTTPAAKSGLHSSSTTESLWERGDVQEYIASVNSSIDMQMSKGCQATPRKIRLSVLCAAPQIPNSNMNRPAVSRPFNGGVVGESKTEQGPTTGVKDEGGIDDEGNDGDDMMAMTQQLMAAMEGKDPDETARLVTRLMDMLQREKEQLQATEEDEGEEGPELEEVEHAIEEKEEILSKLLETVKGYSSMKADFEKLVDTIGELEAERKDLESELEKIKSQQQLQQHQSSAANPLVVEKLKERYNKVKDELARMRSEKSNKENAYKLMQRESKQCESLQKELQKLKDSKVELQRQQKAQVTQFQRLKKDNATKVLSLKKMDLKKQRQLNSLKNELAKKDRVIGNKDKEISRVQSKLRACEDHVTQLLKIQNRNRTRMLNGPAGASGTASGSGIPTSSGGNSRSSMIGVGAGARASMLMVHREKERDHHGSCSAIDAAKGLLPASELEHLVSSKALLDGLVGERLEKHRVKMALERASTTVKDLQKEIAVKTHRLVQLTATRGETLDALASLLTLDREELEACLEDFDSVDNPEVKNKRAQLFATDEGIMELEASIDALHRDMDLAAADLEMLQGSGAGGDMLWDDLGREVVTGLSAAQLQALTWDLLSEKSDALEQLQAVRDESQRLQEQSDATSEASQALEKQLQMLRNEMQSKLQAAEKQRVQDVWDVVRANSAAVDAAAWQRVQLMEQQLLQQTAEAQALQEQHQELLQRAQELDALVLALQLKLDSLRDGAPIGNGSDPVSDELTQLAGVWDDLGLDMQGRAQARDQLQRELLLVRQRLLANTQSQRESTVKAIQQSQQTCALLHTVLVDQTPLPSEESNADGERLLPCLERWSAHQRHLEEVFASRRTKASEMQNRLEALMREMRLEADKEEVSPALQKLCKLSLASEAESLDALARAGMTISSEELKGWESEVRQLNIQRVQISGKLAALVEKTRALAADDLKFSLVQEQSQPLAGSASELRAVGELALAVGGSICDEQDVDRVTAPIMAAAIDLLLVPIVPHSVNVVKALPGSAKILAAMERLQMMLESLKVSRQTVTSHGHSFYEWLKSCLDAASGEEAPPLEAADVPLSRAHIDSLFSQAAALLGQQSSISVTKVWPEWAANRKAAMIRSLLALQTVAKVSWPAPHDTAEEQVEVLLQRALAQPADSMKKAFTEMSELLDEMKDLGMFVEEDFLKLHVQRLTNHWEVFGRPLLFQAAVLLSERRRVDGIVESLREVVKYDQLLNKQVTDMEEFELHSKQDRAKLLSGNSKALIEEEKFRKASKRKYEQLSEKIVSSYGQLQGLLSGQAVASSVPVPMPVLAPKTQQQQQPQTVVPFASTSAVAHKPHFGDSLCVDVAVDCTAFLSSQAQSLVRGKAKEKVELMHLHTTTHGTRRWSGENTNPGNGESQAHETAGPASKQQRSASPTPIAGSKRSLSPVRLGR